MSLRNDQYHEIMRDYDRQQIIDRREFEEREAAIYARFPRLSEIHDLLTENAARRARARILKQTSLAEQLENEADDLKDEQARILRHSGITEYDLEMHYRCPDCKDTGYIQNQPCHCFRQASIKLLYDRSHMGDILLKENFNTLSLEYYSREAKSGKRSQYDYMQEKILQLRDYADRFDEKGGNLLLSGPTGVGKTFLTNCIAKELIETGHFVVYFSAGDFFSMLAKSTFGNDNEETERTDSYITESDLLIIDDLGTERINQFTVSELFSVLNSRLNSGRATVISTNLSATALAENYTERIASRILSNFDILTLYGDDIRILKKFKSGGTHG